MSLKSEERDEIKQTLLRKIYDDNLKSVPDTSKEFGISRQTLYKYLSILESEGKIISVKQGNRKKYSLAEEIHEFKFRLLGLEEDIIWSKYIYPVLAGLKENVLRACNYGFTEILNNAVDHSESEMVSIILIQNPMAVNIFIKDYGVGIFKKIQHAFNLNNPRHSILELVKGKLTTDPDNHSGEGIFFTSRIFDMFYIYSGELVLSSGRKATMDILFDANAEREDGTEVYMEIEKTSDILISEVFDKYTTDEDDFGFSKTYIPVRLVEHEGILLVSRSQSKRLISRFEKFKEVILDFQGVEEVGQAFADELFRVFAIQNPNVELIPVGMNDKVKKMVYRAIKHKIIARN